jgi:hypothetical protein
VACTNLDASELVNLKVIIHVVDSSTIGSLGTAQPQITDINTAARNALFIFHSLKDLRPSIPQTGRLKVEYCVSGMLIGVFS